GRDKLAVNLAEPNAVETGARFLEALSLQFEAPTLAAEVVRDEIGFHGWPRLARREPAAASHKRFAGRSTITLSFDLLDDTEAQQLARDDLIFDLERAAADDDKAAPDLVERHHDARAVAGRAAAEMGCDLVED